MPIWNCGGAGAYLPLHPGALLRSFSAGDSIMAISFLTRVAALVSGRSDVALPRRGFIGAALAGAAVAAVPSLVATPARADDSDRDHVGDALEDLRKARRELVQVDRDRRNRDAAVQQIDQAIAATQRIQRWHR
jgi:hypothetical protein